MASFLSRLGGSGCSMATPIECPGLPEKNGGTDGVGSVDSPVLVVFHTYVSSPGGNCSCNNLHRSLKRI